MLLPFLDALLPPASAITAFPSVGPAAAGAFEALLAGLNAPVATLADEPSAPLPGAALPPTGKSLPGEPGPVADRAVGEPTSEWSADEPGDATVLSRDGATIPSSSRAPDGPAPDSAAPGVAVLAPVAPVALLASPIAAPPVALPVSPNTAAADPAPSPGPRPASDPVPAGRPAIDTARKIAGRALMAAQSGLTPPAVAVTLDPEPRATGANPAPASTEMPKPAQPFAPTLAILPSGALPTAPNGGSQPVRRGPESRFAAVSLALSPEPSPAAGIAAPFALAAVPVTVAPGGPASEATAASTQPAVQSPAQPIALPDHRALVEALVRARAERDPGVSVALETREFGAVALRFETLQSATGERNLQVALSSADPGFERAVASAAAAQAALADQSGRNPASRSDPAPTRTADLSAAPFGDAPGGRTSQSDQQAQQRAAPDSGWRDARHRQSGEPLSRADDHSATPRAERRRGSIFA